MGRVGFRGGAVCRVREVFPFAPAVEIDESLHAAPFHDLALEPDIADGLFQSLVSIPMRGW